MTHFRIKHDAPLSTTPAFVAFVVVPAIFCHLADLFGTAEDAVLVPLAVVRPRRILHVANDSFQEFLRIS
jgi:hypothetical protein